MLKASDKKVQSFSAK